MLQNGLKLWFATYLSKYPIAEPFFIPTNELSVAQDLEKNYNLIFEELKILWQTKEDGYIDYSKYDNLQFPPKSWKKVVLKVWDIENKPTTDRFPFVTSIIKSYPEVMSCFVTKLSGHSIISGHCGVTNANLRIHLGLHIPSTSIDECGMQVGTVRTKWENGKTFSFIDAHYHHVWNKTDSDRYVLIVDIIRPEFVKNRTYICTRAIVSEVCLMIALTFKFDLLLQTTSTMLDILSFLVWIPLWIFIFFNNRYSLVKL